MWRPEANEKVELVHSTKVGSRTLALTNCQQMPVTHCYTWTNGGESKRKDGSSRIKFVCAECRRLRDAKKESKDTPLPKLFAVRGTDKQVRWTGEGKDIHFCTGPKDREEVISVATF
jgi:hypothetical protein